MSASRGPRVVHVSHTAHLGGAELALVRLLAQDPPWVPAICAPPAGDAFAPLDHEGVAVRRCLPHLPSGGTQSRNPVLAMRYLAAMGRGARALRREPLARQADVVHANTAAAAIMCALAGAASRPLVVHLRDIATPESLGRFGLAAFTRIALPRADAVIANSRSTLDLVGDLLGPDVLRAVIASPIGLARPATAFGVRPAVGTVGMIGRLQRRKGQHVFLAAFARAFGGTAVRAHLAGAPLPGERTYVDQLRRQAGDLGIADQVTFLGHVEDTTGFLASLDILVHASILPEAMGQTVLQGLAHGLPLVATAGGGPSEWLRSGSNALVVEPADPDALAAAMTWLAGSYETRSRLAVAAAGTPGILTDAECTALHGEFFDRVWRRRRGAGEAA
jgi:glycosyltransferase involved in cell wall biosynthesis